MGPGWRLVPFILPPARRMTGQAMHVGVATALFPAMAGHAAVTTQSCEGLGASP